MDTENKTPLSASSSSNAAEAGSTPSATTADTSAPAKATPEQKPQEQAPANPTPPPADSKPAEEQKTPVDTKLEPKAESATPPSAPTSKKSASGMWLFVFVAAIVCGAAGFVLGQGTAPVSHKNDQQAPTPTVTQGKKVVNTKITGNVKTDAHGLSYLIVDVSEYGSVKATNHETRYVLDPQANREYSYTFAELKPNVSYVVTMQGCAEKDQKATCVLSKKIVTCSGRIPGGAVQQCLINGDGQADFFLDKNLVNEFVTPTETPTPTPESPAATP